MEVTTIFLLVVGRLSNVKEGVSLGAKKIKVSEWVSKGVRQRVEYRGV